MKRLIAFFIPSNTYILPLHKKSGSLQLFVLITMMTALTLIVVSIHASLFKTAERWSYAIKHQASIEVPKVKDDGSNITEDEVRRHTERILDILKNYNNAYDISPMAEKDLQNLLTPWLDNDSQLLNFIPLPTLINFKWKDSADISFSDLTDRIESIVPNARISNHRGWLDKFLGITRSVHAIGSVILLITIITTIFVIISTVRARMTIFKEEISLLHIMGARDSFILKQFLRYLSQICIPASFLAYVLSFAILSILSTLFLSNDGSLIPDFTPSYGNYIIMLSVPFFICGLALFTGSKTINVELRKLV